MLSEKTLVSLVSDNYFVRLGNYTHSTGNIFLLLYAKGRVFEVIFRQKNMNEKAKLEQEYQAQIKEGILTYKVVFNLPTAFDNNLEISSLRNKRPNWKPRKMPESIF